MLAVLSGSWVGVVPFSVVGILHGARLCVYQMLIRVLLIRRIHEDQCDERTATACGTRAKIQ